MMFGCWLHMQQHRVPLYRCVTTSMRRCFKFCNSPQYHTWARRKDNDAAAKLRKLRDCVRRWEGSISPDHMSVRRKAGFDFLQIKALGHDANFFPLIAFPTGSYRRPRSSLCCMKQLRDPHPQWRHLRLIQQVG